jgi:hypothetical protein
MQRNAEVGLFTKPSFLIYHHTGPISITSEQESFEKGILATQTIFSTILKPALLQMSDEGATPFQNSPFELKQWICGRVASCLTMEFHKIFLFIKFGQKKTLQIIEGPKWFRYATIISIPLALGKNGLFGLSEDSWGVKCTGWNRY